MRRIFHTLVLDICRYNILMSYFQRKMLAVYMHHDASVLTNVFCTQVLKCVTLNFF
jgi:hypothetical protein